MKREGDDFFLERTKEEERRRRCLPGKDKRGREKETMSSWKGQKRVVEGRRQSEEHWNCFKATLAAISKRGDGVHMGFPLPPSLPERTDTTMNRTKVN